MAQLNPFLRFNEGKCREAMDFYQTCFGGELTFMTIGETPMGKDMPPEKQHYIVHAELKSNTLIFFGSDMMRDKAIIGDQAGMALNCESEEEIKTLFEKLAQGGEIFCPLGDSFWGSLFAMVTDKYGIEWMLNYPKK